MLSQCSGTCSEHTGTREHNLAGPHLRRRSPNGAVGDKLTRKEWMTFIFNLLGCRRARSKGCSAVLKTNKKCERTVRRPNFTSPSSLPIVPSVLTPGHNDWEERCLWNLELNREFGPSFALWTVTLSRISENTIYELFIIQRILEKDYFCSEVGSSHANNLTSFILPSLGLQDMEPNSRNQPFWWRFKLPSKD